MKIKLKNFRFHEDFELEIPDEGFVLLSGVSGRGKTTILNGITYAFYGRTRVPYTHGKTTCRVDLEYKKDGRTVYITRSSHPNILTVKYKKGEYEGDAAQGVLDKILTINFDVYMASSYIVQQTYRSVLFMTPAQQLEFVETLTFNTDDHIECRQKFKSYTKECQTGVFKCEEQITLLKSQIQSSQECIKRSYDSDTIPDLGDLDPKQVRNEVQSIKKSIETLQKTDKSLGKKLKELQEEEDTKKTLVEEKKKLETELSQYKKMRANIGSIKLEDEVDKLEKKLQKTKRWLEQTRAYDTYTESLSSVDLLEEEHFKELKLQVKELKKQVPDDKKINALEKSCQKVKEEAHEESQEVKENMKNKIKKDDAVENVKRIFKEVKKLYDTQVKKPTALLEYLLKEKTEAEDDITKENDSLERNTNHLRQREAMKKVYQCPKCSSKLAVLDEILIFTKELPKSDKKDYQRNIDDNKELLETLNGEIIRISVWMGDLDDAIPFYKLKISGDDSVTREELRKLEKELKTIEDTRELVKNVLNQIKNKAIPTSILKVREEIEAKKKFPENFKPRNTADELQSDIEGLTSELESSKRQKGDHASMSREISARQEKLKKINKRLGHDRKVGVPDETAVATVESITDKLTENRKNTMGSVKRLTELQEDLEIVSAYDIYQKDISREKELKYDLKHKESELRLATKNLEAAHGLEQTVKEAEILAMEKTLSNINEFSRPYLEEMFSEPITVTLENYKDDSKGKSTSKKDCKLKMNTVVFYHGKRYNSIDELSGGEKQRCNLAFILAVNSMVGSSFLFLDECLNFLDAGANMDILTHLRSVADEKLVLVVSHEAIKGNFDDIIEL
uniref:Chromosome segregation ATPase n=1 Tax=Marseillevirus LCMAC101 TaxID=2506602 RepID=A0A481YS17_9VIRU|nr:MAG: chromosome segregation ATPase [Marseillevirus LCMAC101]